MCLTPIDTLRGREWFFEHFTVVDTYFFWAFLRAKRFNLQYLDLSRLVHCQAHHERMLLRTSVGKLLAFEQQTQQDFAAA
jgi:glutathione S-transferase